MWPSYRSDGSGALMVVSVGRDRRHGAPARRRPDDAVVGFTRFAPMRTAPRGSNGLVPS
jgi:hypothetical protein